MSIRVITLLLVLLTGAYGFMIFKTLMPNRGNEDEPDGNIVWDKERNEQSTPRSFILPATPAVAEEQERKSTKHSEANDNRCLLKLESIGYQFDSHDTSFNAKYIQAIIDFQRQSGLNISGEIDQQTRSRLDC